MCQIYFNFIYLWDTDTLMNINIKCDNSNIIYNTVSLLTKHNNKIYLKLLDLIYVIDKNVIIGSKRSEAENILHGPVLLLLLGQKQANQSFSKLAS